MAARRSYKREKLANNDDDYDILTYRRFYAYKKHQLYVINLIYSSKLD